MNNVEKDFRRLLEVANRLSEKGYGLIVLNEEKEAARRLVELGLLEQDGGVFQITDKGKEALC